VTKDKGMVALNWLVNDQALTMKDQLVLGILDHILMGSRYALPPSLSASFLYKRLIESGLGESVIGGGLDDTLLQNTFSVGLKGVKEEDFPKVPPFPTSLPPSLPATTCVLSLFKHSPST